MNTKGAMVSLTKYLRRRAAILIAVAYAFCVLAPSAALALGANPAAFHCLPETAGMANAAEHDSATHVHADGSAHAHGEQSRAPDHHSDKSGKTGTGDCCGLFCVTALSQDSSVTFGLSTPASSSVAALSAGLRGSAPAPLHRPPIA